MDVTELVSGHFYRAKKPKRVSDGGYDDRRVLWISEDRSKIQYDSPTIGQGRHYPTIPTERFLKWVGKEITKEEYESTN